MMPPVSSSSALIASMPADSIAGRMACSYAESKFMSGPPVGSFLVPNGINTKHKGLSLIAYLVAKYAHLQRVGRSAQGNIVILNREQIKSRTLPLHSMAPQHLLHCFSPSKFARKAGACLQKHFNGCRIISQLRIPGILRSV